MLQKRIPSIFIAAAIMFTAIFSVSIFANAASKFTPRLSEPSSSNKYYYSDINVFHKYGWGMPNCTAYAYGRAYEILKSEPKLSWGNAELWYDYNKDGGYYKYGKTPKLGAIACWSYDGGGGHVAVVEKIENGKITFSNSAYSGDYFYLTDADVSDSNAGGSSWWNFQGYIYIGDFDQPDIPDPITYKAGVYQTDVTDSLNMRSGAGTSYSIVTSIPNAVKLNVTKTDGNWGYTSYNSQKGWVCLEYCKYISELPATEPQTTAPQTTAPTTPVLTTSPLETTEPSTEPSTTSHSGGIGVGDVNCDGRINILDATLIQKYLASMVTITDEQKKYADFDFNGRVNILDATKIQKYLVGLY